MILPGSYANGFAPRDGQPLYPELWRGCVCSWAPCLGPTGLTLRDWSGRGNHGTLTNGPTWSTSSGNYNLEFDGTDDVVTSSVPPLNNVVCSQSYWFQRTATSALSSFVGVGVAGSESNRFVIQPWSDGVVYVSMGQTVWGNFSSNDLLRHHLVAVFDGNQTGNANRLKCWLDGRPVTLSFTGTIPSNIGSPASIRFGQTYNVESPFGSGRIFDYGIYARTLASQEIQILARRPGIAFELAPRRRSRASVLASLRYNIFTGNVGSLEVIGAS